MLEYYFGRSQSQNSNLIGYFSIKGLYVSCQSIKRDSIYSSLFQAFKGDGTEQTNKQKKKSGWGRGESEGAPVRLF